MNTLGVVLDAPEAPSSRRRSLDAPGVDLETVRDMAAGGRLSFADLVIHTAPAMQARAADRSAFEDPDRLKMVLAWKNAS